MRLWNQASTRDSVYVCGPVATHYSRLCDTCCCWPASWRCYCHVWRLAHRGTRRECREGKRWRTLINRRLGCTYFRFWPLTSTPPVGRRQN